MIIYNDYLKSLGMKPDDYPFDKVSYDKLDKDLGVCIEETWNLNLTMAIQIYTYLCALRDVKAGHPACLGSMEEWNDILNEMIEGFADYILRRDDVDFHPDNSKLEKSLKLMGEWWEALWW